MNTTIEIARKELNKRYNLLVGTSATNLCTHCGWCVDACHIFLATNDPSKSPVAKAERVRSVMKKEHDWLSKLFPGWTGAKDLTEEELDEWLNAAFRDCTLCERCVVNCPMDVETPQILAAARGTLSAVGKQPEILEDLVEMSIARAENLDVYRESFAKNIPPLEAEVKEITKNPNATIPVETIGAKMLYVPLAGEHTIVPPAVIFNLVEASWTMSMFESSNYGLFMADTAKAKVITKRILDEAERLGVEEIIISECGHAYGVLKWEAPKWFGGKLPFKVRSILEVFNEFVADGKITLDPAKVSERVTYHDPCNIGRKGGLFEEPRNVISQAVSDFVEMTPNRVQNYCCGAGGGMVAYDEWHNDRIKYGMVKADQIKETGATRVITSCDNCMHQITELGEHYDLDIKVSNVSQLLMDSIVV